MSSVTVDASVVVDALVGPDAAHVHERIGNRDLLAPAHIDAEVLNALRGLHLGGHLSEGRCREALGDFAALTVSRWPLEGELLERGFDLVQSMTAYDALYVVLAQLTDTPLLTRDVPLSRAARRLVAVEVF